MREVDDPTELAELFGQDRSVHPYGLADLDSPIWERSVWFRRGDAAAGIVDLGDGVTTVYAISTADPSGSIALVVELLDRIPAGAMITGPIGLAVAMAGECPVDDLGLHVKYVLVDSDRLPAVTGTVDLAADDFARLAALHATDPGAAFVLESMLADETFVGLPHPDGSSRLAAAAGTHCVSTRHDIAAVGGVFVDPAFRGRGHGAVVTAAVCHRLRGRVSTIGLNVAASNIAARRSYERLGFVACLDYEEVIVHPEHAPR